MVYLIESSYHKKSTSMISSILGEETEIWRKEFAQGHIVSKW